MVKVPRRCKPTAVEDKPDSPACLFRSLGTEGIVPRRWRISPCVEARSDNGHLPPKLLVSRFERRFHWIYGNLLSPSTARFVFHRAVNQGKEGVVSTQADVPSRVDARTQLANENIPRQNELTVKTLHASPLSITVTTISAASLTFFVCHD